MTDESSPHPASYKGVMVSSTFTDLIQHRNELMKALRKEELFARGMEEYVPSPDDDVISSSLNMVAKGSAYIGLVSHRCGQIPECPTRNPHGYSITRLEFEEAQRLGLPALVFIMGNDHYVKPTDVETDPEKRMVLEEFRKRAKEGRIYVVFNSLEEFTRLAIHAVAKLRRYLDEQATPTEVSAPATETGKPAPDKQSDGGCPIPKPPDFYAEPPYIGSHDFVGRQAQLDVLNDWASPADPHPVLLFEAIGGQGKSMLTWEWVTKYAGRIREDWAGCFWYSFYEKGAIMADFCSRALAYITSRPLEEFRTKKTTELSELLLHHLNAKPWLIVFDGLERVLVAYHRYDAAQMTDEDAGAATDKIAKRDPCSAIRPQDDELLRALAGAEPSKLLLTSRLIPRALINASNQPIQGVLRERLSGLRPPEAEELFKACSITGNSSDIRSYLQTHCDCHPLVIGVLAGLVNNYLPDRGNFDAWAADPDGGGGLNLAELNLVKKRNHILHTAIAALSEEGRRLLSTLALIDGSVDFPTLCAFNPYSESDQGRTGKLTDLITDLERRGLVQYGHRTQRYDLHPVVRGVAVGRLEPDETKRFGQQVVDHFSQRPHNPYEQAETVEDVRDGLYVMKTLIRMGDIERALTVYRGELSQALLFNLESYSEVLALIRPVIPKGCYTLPDTLSPRLGSYVANDLAIALDLMGETHEGLKLYNVSLESDIKQEAWESVRTGVSNISMDLEGLGELARAEACSLLGLRLAELLGLGEHIFVTRMVRFYMAALFGHWEAAKDIWSILDPMGRSWSRSFYRPGNIERYFATARFWEGNLEEHHLTKAEQLATRGRNRLGIRTLHLLRGEWLCEQGLYSTAASELYESVRMGREVGVRDRPATKAETLLAVTKIHTGRLREPRLETERLANQKMPFDRGLAELWLKIGDEERAKKHALAAYKWAWSDGEPYVRRYELNKSKELLEGLGLEAPNLPSYDPSTYEKFPWEDELLAAIKKLEAEKESKPH